MQQQSDPEARAVDECVRVLKRRHLKRETNGRGWYQQLSAMEIDRVLTYLRLRFVEHGNRR